MAVVLKQIDEVYETDTEEEAEDLISKIKKDFNVTKSSVSYKFKKSEQREYYIATVRKNFIEEFGE